jgi:hypothetical protein
MLASVMQDVECSVKEKTLVDNGRRKEDGMGWAGKAEQEARQKNKMEVGHARPLLVGATLAPAIPARTPTCACRSRLFHAQSGNADPPSEHSIKPHPLPQMGTLISFAPGPGAEPRLRLRSMQAIGMQIVE